DAVVVADIHVAVAPVNHHRPGGQIGQVAGDVGPGLAGIGGLEHAAQAAAGGRAAYRIDNIPIRGIDGEGRDHERVRGGSGGKIRGAIDPDIAVVFCYVHLGPVG